MQATDMISISNANPAAMAATTTTQTRQEENRQGGGTLKSCFSGVGSAYYATPGWNLNGGAIGRAAGKKISAYMTQVRNDGYDTAAIGRKEGQRIATDIQRKLTRQVSFSTSNR